MLKHTIFILFIFLSLSNPIFSQTKKEDKERMIAPNCEDVKGKLFKDTSEIKDYSGPAKWCYPNGKVMRICTYEKGKREGEFWLYDNSGYLKSTGSHKGDLIHGEYMQFHPNGNVFFKVNCQNGLMHGVKYDYSLKGELLKKSI